MAFAALLAVGPGCASQPLAPTPAPETSSSAPPSDTRADSDSKDESAQPGPELAHPASGMRFPL
ncbi:MAG TPA: hypothetical protein PK095_24385, partial [Myxococcota bacterium]|nr:hypothetical protein [Myxococcota bacterium]